MPDPDRKGPTREGRPFLLERLAGRVGRPESQIDLGAPVRAGHARHGHGEVGAGPIELCKMQQVGDDGFYATAAFGGDDDDLLGDR